ncbi:hypothetical protein JCM11641_005648 [Rhodosporidiobolus odoratus]
MVRLSLAALGLTVFTSVYAAEAPSGESVSDIQCSEYTNGEGDAALCGPLHNLAGTLIYQGDSVTTNADALLQSVNAAIEGSGENDITDILKTATDGIVSNLAYGVSFILGSAASTIQQAAPQCKCDLSTCLSRLQAADQASAVPTEQAQASCAQARFACASIYSDDQIEQLAPGCANYEGTTGDDDSSSSKKRFVRRSVRFSRE